MFYDHPFDNFRVLGLLLRAWRIQGDLSQEALGEKVGITRGLVNAAENLHSVEKSRHDTRTMNRETLLKIISGLKPEEIEKKADALLWLFDGGVLEKWEKMKFKIPDSDIYPEDFDPMDDVHLIEEAPHKESLRETVLELIKESLRVYTEKAEQNRRLFPVRVIGYRDGDDKRDRVGEELLAMEQVESVRLLVRPLPSYVILKNLFLKDGEIKTRERRHETGVARVEVFFSRIKEFGIRNIHEEGAIRQYLNPGTDTGELDHKLLGERKEQIAVLIKLLESHKKYQVRIAEENPTPFNFQISGLDTVILSPPELMGKKIKEKYKNSYTKRIKLTGEENVLPFLIEFESLWNELSKKQKSNDHAIKILRNLLQQAPT